MNKTAVNYSPTRSSASGIFDTKFETEPNSVMTYILEESLGANSYNIGKQVMMNRDIGFMWIACIGVLFLSNNVTGIAFFGH
jgi:hypothetical protein